MYRHQAFAPVRSVGRAGFFYGGIMSYWANKAMHKRQREKTASKKTREGLMDAYHKLREINEEKQRQVNRDREGKDKFSPQEGMEGFPTPDGEVGGEPVSTLRSQENR
jgi:hypothetical protein